jgi:hypothetical protein
MSESAGRVVAWQVRVFYPATRREPVAHWSKWQEIDKRAYDKAVQTGSYYEYDTIETRALVPEQLLVEEEFASAACAKAADLFRLQLKEAEHKLGVVRALADEIEKWSKSANWPQPDPWASKLRALTETPSEETTK